MNRKYMVDVFRDEEARVWVALGRDIPGLTLEAATFPELRNLIDHLGPELWAENRPSMPPITATDIHINVPAGPPLD